MTKQELAEKLVEIYTNSGTIVTASLGVFTFTYGEYAVDQFTPTELIEAAHAINPEVKTRYRAELNAAFAMYRYFKSHPNLFALGRAALTSGKEIKGLVHQLITYGAPGTGKSHGIEEVVKAYADTVRTTFHPDSDYATFVGCYKPTMERVKKTYVLEGKEADVKDDGGNTVFEDRIVIRAAGIYQGVCAGMEKDDPWRRRKGCAAVPRHRGNQSRQLRADFRRLVPAP